MPFIWPPPKRSVRVAVVIPASNLSVLPGLREKTEVVGEFARALAIYRVDDVVVYDDEFSEEGDAELFLILLNYLLVPPYLRKKLIPITPHLRYAGVLHPLNIVTHNPQGKGPSQGDLREGLVITSWGRKAKVFIGVKRLCYTTSDRDVKPGERVLVRVVRAKPLNCRVESPDRIEEYVGFKTYRAGSDVVDIINAFKGCVILASKDGFDYNDPTIKSEVLASARRRGRIVILLGNPKADFDEIVGASVMRRVAGDVHRLNFIPKQGTLSVRTVEALHAILAQLNSDLA